MDTRREMMGGVLSSSKLIDNYLTIEALEDGLFASLSYNACEYCIDGDENWRSLPMDTTTETINTGQTLSFRGEITPTSYGIGSFSVNKKFNLLGNCMSLLFGDNAANNFSLEGKGGAFTSLFEASKVVEVSDNFLPATTLAEDCYVNMFNSCGGLTTAPALPATTLAGSCYYGMFQDCISLTTAPSILPATTLTNDCYAYMFWNCDNLTEAPELPATTLAAYCYDSMFDHCISLVNAPELPATTLATGCYIYMFNGCSSLQNAPSLPATTLASNCYYSMFANCTSLVNAPTILPAITLETYCYDQMFSGCSWLRRAPELPALRLTAYCYSHMFRHCTSLNYIKMLAIDISATNCLNDWVYFGTSSIGTFVKNKDATWNVTGESGIPDGWTVQTV